MTDLDEGADPADATQGPAEGPATDGSATTSDQDGAAPTEDVSSFARYEGEAADAYARRIFERVFGHDIERVLRMDVSAPACACQHAHFVTCPTLKIACKALKSRPALLHVKNNHMQIPHAEQAIFLHC